MTRKMKPQRRNSLGLTILAMAMVISCGKDPVKNSTSALLLSEEAWTLVESYRVTPRGTWSFGPGYFYLKRNGSKASFNFYIESPEGHLHLRYDGELSSDGKYVIHPAPGRTEACGFKLQANPIQDDIYNRFSHGEIAGTYSLSQTTQAEKDLIIHPCR